MKKAEKKKLLEQALEVNPGNEEARKALDDLSGPSKYNSQKTEIDGIIFDSKKEAAYYYELKLRRMAGEITEVELQPKFVLMEGFEKNGKTYRPITYHADFLVTLTDGTQEVIDVKGYKTEKFRIKQKLFERRYPELNLKLIE